MIVLQFETLTEKVKKKKGLRNTTKICNQDGEVLC